MQTREALLIDEEREDGTFADAEVAVAERREAEPVADTIAEPVSTAMQQGEASEPTISTEQFGDRVSHGLGFPSLGSASTLDSAADAYLRALLEQNAAQTASAVEQSGKSEDMLVDSINEALFDLVGDTVIEFGAAGPQIIEDYEADVRGYLDYE